MLLALLVAVAEPVAPPVPPRSSQNGVEAPIRADALSLVGVLNPEGPMVDMAVRNFGDSMRTVVGKSEDYFALEKDYPGISEALVEAMTTTLRADLISDLPALRRRYARFYSDKFSPDETAELMRFYSSRAGQRLIVAKFANVDATPLVGEFVDDPNAQVSRQHIRDMNQNVTSSVLEGMSAEDLNALQQFAKSPVFLKLRMMRNAIEQLEADVANEPDPELDAALGAATNAVFLKFTGKPLPPE